MKDERGVPDGCAKRSLGEADHYLEEVIEVHPLDAGEAAVKADAAPLVLLGMINAGLTLRDLRMGLEMAGVDPRSRRWRRSLSRGLGQVSVGATGH